MKCSKNESDLLLHALGELPCWRSWTVSRHLSKCRRCRERQARLAATAREMAVALQPPVGGPRIPRPPVAILHGWLAVAAIVLFVAAAFLAVQLARGAFAGSPPARDIPCRPDLPNDRCR